MSSSVPGRRNGFSHPYSPAQISAWMALFFTFAQFLIIVSPVMPLDVSIPVTVVFGAMIATVIYYGGLTQIIDPMDPHLRKHLALTQPDVEGQLGAFYKRFNSLKKDEPESATPTTTTTGMKQCWLCDAQVAEPSMHCKFCNKCVNHFDHHCIWLNTCIGKENYVYFFRTVLSIFLMQIAHILIQLVLVVDAFTGGSTLTRIQQSYLSSVTAFYVICIFFMVFDLISLFLIGQLLVFHIGLQREKLTTYQYIVRDHARKRQETRVAGMRATHRTRLMATARQQGHRWVAWRLQLGGMCREAGCAACDPIQKLPDEETGFANSLGTASPQNAAVESTSSSSPTHNQQQQQEEQLRQSNQYGNGVSTKISYDGTEEDAGNNEAVARSSSSPPPQESAVAAPPVKEADDDSALGEGASVEMRAVGSGTAGRDGGVTFISIHDNTTSPARQEHHQYVPTATTRSSAATTATTRSPEAAATSISARSPNDQSASYDNDDDGLDAVRRFS